MEIVFDTQQGGRKALRSSKAYEIEIKNQKPVHFHLSQHLASRLPLALELELEPELLGQLVGISDSSKFFHLTT